MKNCSFITLLLICSIQINNTLHLDLGSLDDGTEIGKLKRHIAKGLLPQIRQKLINSDKKNVTINTTSITNTITKLNENNDTNNDTVTTLTMNNITIENQNSTETIIVNTTTTHQENTKVTLDHFFKNKTNATLENE